jgi:RNA polymerase sigma-70 factor (ECF subfamily)
VTCGVRPGTGADGSRRRNSAGTVNRDAGEAVSSVTFNDDPDRERPRRRRRPDRAPPAAADEALIRALYADHGGALLAYVTRLTGDRAAAEDVVQETLVRAWRNQGVLTNGRGSVRGWLFTVARNIVIDQVRAKAARPTEVAAPTETLSVEGDPAQQVVDSIVVLEALEGLSQEHRRVIEEIYFRGRTVAEVAQALDIPAGTVKSRSYYALRALRDKLGPRSAREEAAR